MSDRVRAAYEGYAAKTGGKTFDGRDMPQWGELPTRIREAWAAAVEAVDAHPSTRAHLICAVVSPAGPRGELVACAHPPYHDGPCSWASLAAASVPARDGSTR